MKGLKPPPLEEFIGIGCYKTKTMGIAGRLKQQPEDFIVEEVSPDGFLEFGKDSLSSLNQSPLDFVHCTLEKKNWDTMRAVKEIARRLCVSQKRVGYAGTKDKRAFTAQRISIQGVSIEDVQKISIKDIVLRDFSYENDSIGLGSLDGNRFSITIRNCEKGADELKTSVDSISESLKSGFPNFFGVQRFGTTRPITHLVGRLIVKGDFEGAVMAYLAKVFEGEGEGAVEAREFLEKTRDFKEALKVYPKNLGYEISLLNHLAQDGSDFRGALRVLPDGLKKMFVHAYQSYIFNRSLSMHIENELVVERLPLIGFESTPDEFTEKILEEESLKPGDFRISGLSELSSRGEIRDCFVPFEDFSVLDAGVDELNEGRNKITLRFRLNPGVYATTLLREFMKNEYWL